MQSFFHFPNDRYAALEEIRIMLGFGQPEWNCLLAALLKTDNGWLEFMFGDLTIDFKKFVDMDELHLRLRLDLEKNKSTKSAQYLFDLKEFTKPKTRKSHVDSLRE